MRFLPARLLLLLPLMLTLPASAEHHGGGGGKHYEAIEVSEDLYMLIGRGGFLSGNLGMSVGEDAVVLIDGGMPPSLELLNKAITQITPEAPDFLINTHIHGDHIGNNTVFAESGAHIVSHHTLRSRLLEQGLNDQPADPASLPVITVAEEMMFHLNGAPARIIHTPAAHTDGDAMVAFPKVNVVFAGDLFFHGLFPFIDLDNGGSVDGFIAAQEQILAMVNDDTKIVPGHGELASATDLKRDLTMLKDARALVAGLIAADHDIDAILAANPLAKYHDDYNWGFITTERMTRTIYRDITGM